MSQRIEITQGVQEYSVSQVGDTTPYSIDETFGLFKDLANTRIHYWTSDWGSEWEPVVLPFSNTFEIHTIAGRSSKGFHPFIIIEDGSNATIIAVAFSGNWKLKIGQVGELLQVQGGVSSIEGEVALNLQPEDFPKVYVSTSALGIQAASNQLTAAMRKISTRGPRKMKMEWDPWWPYEDLGMNQEAFLRNARVAAEVGIDVALMDAGWFGPPDRSSHWFDYRGDWDLINYDRFPGGIGVLAEKTRELGIEFGIWIEFEALGELAQLNIQEPSFMAQSIQGTEIINLGYICFANPLAQDFAFRSMSNLVESYGVTWIKMDFNVDPGVGCQRIDHGHTRHDGLLRHNNALYEVLDKFHDRFPDVIVEACSSGGLRWDLGLAQHVDVGFSSDTDWPEHALACFWASSKFFPVEQLLGWCDSQWRGDHIHQNFTVEDLGDTDHLDFILSISLLGAFGVSQRLEDFSKVARAKLATYCSLYVEQFRPRYQAETNIVHLTGQPQRELLGERQVAFALETSGFKTLIMAFTLPGAIATKMITYASPEIKPGSLLRDLITGDLVAAQIDVGSLTLELGPEENQARILVLENIE
jgi:alpha-galactosidase